MKSAGVHSSELDEPDRYTVVRQRLRTKASLRKFYTEVYARYAECLARSPPGGVALEIGSGAGFVKDVLPDVMTSDIINYPGIDRILDARHLNFPDASLRAVLMLNVFHHISDVAAFLHEVGRCLMDGGRVLIVDQHVGCLSRRILRRLHEEPFDPDAQDWCFESTGPVSGANGALAWMVFCRDRQRFEQDFPALKLIRYEPHTPLRYWLCGGLKRWSLLPRFLWPIATLADHGLVGLNSDLGSFVDVELQKINSQR
jgi:SAM-dependent methyltransferase